MSDAPARDPLVLALGSAAAGAALGGAVITTGVIVLRTLDRDRSAPLDRDAAFTVLTASVVGGVAAALAIGWLLSRGITETWRRGVTALIALFGACLLAVAAAPADLLARRPGLLIYLVCLLALGAFSYRQARLAGRP